MSEQESGQSDAAFVTPALTRRAALRSALAVGAAALAPAVAAAAPAGQPVEAKGPALGYILVKRIKNVHLKEFTKKGTDHSLESFRPLLDGTTNWPAVLEAFNAIGYRGHLTFEYFHPYSHYPEALVFQTSDSLDRMLGRKQWAAG